MKNKQWIWIAAAIAALVAVIGLMLGIWIGTRPDASEGSKTITVEIVHADGKTNSYTIQTDAKTLAEAMNEKGLLGEDLDGMYLTIDGETTDYTANQSWWCLYENGSAEMAMEGANTMLIEDGDSFKWVYTIG